MMFPTDYNFTNSIQSTATATNAQNKVGRSFKFDYKTHRFVFEDGREITAPCGAEFERAWNVIENL